MFFNLRRIEELNKDHPKSFFVVLCILYVWCIYGTGIDVTEARDSFDTK